MKHTIAKALTVSSIILAIAGAVHTSAAAITISRDIAGSLPWTFALLVPGAVYIALVILMQITAMLLRRSKAADTNRK